MLNQIIVGNVCIICIVSECPRLLLITFQRSVLASKGGAVGMLPMLPMLPMSSSLLLLFNRIWRRNFMCSKERRQQIALDIKENQMAVILKTLLEYSQTLWWRGPLRSDGPWCWVAAESWSSPPRSRSRCWCWPIREQGPACCGHYHLCHR